MPEAFKYLELVATAKPSTPWFERYGQFEMASALESYTKKFGPWLLSRRQSDAPGQTRKSFLIKKWHDMALYPALAFNRMDVETFYRQHHRVEERLVPGLLAAGAVLGFTYYIPSKMFSCEQEDVIDAYRHLAKKLNRELPTILHTHALLPYQAKVATSLADDIRENKAGQALTEKCGVQIHFNPPS